MSRELEFFFDIGSAYSYLASTQVAAVAERAGASLRWRPFLLGGVFKSTGNHAPADNPAKARWMLQDLDRWARHYGVPFRFASRFPQNTLRPQRALTAASRQAGEAVLARFAATLFRAYWVDDADVTTDLVIGAAAAAAGLDCPQLLAGIEDPETKALLRAATDEAVARGAFGAPSLFVGEQLFWGNDRLPFVEAALRPE